MIFSRFFAKRSFLVRGHYLRKLFAVAFQMFKISLAHSLVNGYCNGVGKIERAAALFHGHTQRTFKMLFEHILGQALCLLAENKERALRIRNFRIYVACFFGKEPHLLVFVLFKELRQVFVIMYLKLVPIIKSRAFHLFVVYLKAQRLYKVQCRPRNRTSARNISRVLRYLGFNQNYIKICHFKILRKIYI